MQTMTSLHHGEALATRDARVAFIVGSTLILRACFTYAIVAGGLIVGVVAPSAGLVVAGILVAFFGARICFHGGSGTAWTDLLLSVFVGCAVIVFAVVVATAL